MNKEIIVWSFMAEKYGIPADCPHCYWRPDSSSTRLCKEHTEYYCSIELLGGHSISGFGFLTNETPILRS